MNVFKYGPLAASLLCGLAITASADDRAVRAVTTNDPAHQNGFTKASDLIGMQVRGTDNQELGEVQDLLIDRRTNEVEYLILDTGVFADLDGKQPIVPWMLMDAHAGAEAGTHYLFVDMTQDRIKTAPTIILGEADLTQTPAWVSQVDEFYSTELQERRVSRPDLDRNRRDAAPRNSRETDRATPETQRQKPNTSNLDRNPAKPGATATPKAPKQPINP